MRNLRQVKVKETEELAGKNGDQRVIENEK